MVKSASKPEAGVTHRPAHEGDAGRSIDGGLSNEQITLLRRTIADDLSDDEFGLYLIHINRTKLDPFSRQIYYVKKWNKKKQREEVAFQTNIDGYRLTADRTGLYAGNDDYVHTGGPGAERPTKATATVYKIVNAERVPFSASARWSEYYISTSPIWNKMPFLMLGKCAEALALRKAFPQELSCVYTSEEMGQADADSSPEPARPPAYFAIAERKSAGMATRATADKMGDVARAAAAGIAEKVGGTVTTASAGQDQQPTCAIKDDGSINYHYFDPKWPGNEWLAEIVDECRRNPWTERCTWGKKYGDYLLIDIPKDAAAWFYSDTTKDGEPRKYPTPDNRKDQFAAVVYFKEQIQEHIKKIDSQGPGQEDEAFIDPDGLPDEECPI